MAKNPILDKAINDRFMFFVRKYVDPKQAEIAVKLATTQSAISYIENYKRAVNYKLISKLIKEPYNLNVDWLTTGEGKHQIKGTDKKNSLLIDITNLRAETQANTKFIKILEINLNKAYQIIGELEKRVEQLERT